MPHTKRPLRVLISGGGTGGHIFPALSIAAAVEKTCPGSKILFVGAENRMEMQRVPAAGYEIVGLPVSGFDRKHLWRNIKVIFKLLKCMRMARSIVRAFKPDIAVGVGGYASGPTLKAAQRAGVPTVIQEQNSYAGVTNKLLASKAKAICVAYEGMERFFPADRIVLTGNPVRARLLNPGISKEDAKQALGFDPARPLVMIVGGSLGALSINEAMMKTVREGRVAQAPFSVLWQTGSRYIERCRKAEEEHPSDNLTVTDFVTDMAVAYRAADLVVSRAGAGTISELELLGKPAILVPSPNVAEDHQRHNAEALAERGAAGLVPDADVKEILWDEISTVIGNTETLAALSHNIKAMALPDAAEKIVDVMIDVLDNKTVK